MCQRKEKLKKVVSGGNEKLKKGDCVEENERLKKVFVLKERKFKKKYDCSEGKKRLRKMVMRKEKLKPKKSIELKERKS